MEEALLTNEGRHIRDLCRQAMRIAGEFGENVEELSAFVAKHPEIARFFPHCRLVAA